MLAGFQPFLNSILLGLYLLFVQQVFYVYCQCHIIIMFAKIHIIFNMLLIKLIFLNFLKDFSHPI